jgi:hypothetical protein
VTERRTHRRHGRSQQTKVPAAEDLADVGLKTKRRWRTPRLGDAQTMTGVKQARRCHALPPSCVRRCRVERLDRAEVERPIHSRCQGHRTYGLMLGFAHHWRLVTRCSLSPVWRWTRAAGGTTRWMHDRVGVPANHAIMRAALSAMAIRICSGTGSSRS